MEPYYNPLEWTAKKGRKSTLSSATPETGALTQLIGSTSGGSASAHNPVEFSGPGDPRTAKVVGTALNLVSGLVGAPPMISRPINGAITGGISGSGVARGALNGLAGVALNSVIPGFGLVAPLLGIDVADFIGRMVGSTDLMSGSTLGDYHDQGEGDNSSINIDANAANQMDAQAQENDANHWSGPRLSNSGGTSSWSESNYMSDTPSDMGEGGLGYSTSYHDSYSDSGSESEGMRRGGRVKRHEGALSRMRRDRC